MKATTINNPGQPQDLSKDEATLLRLFRTMDDWGRDFVLSMAGFEAEQHPRHARPTLRLVAGGAA